MSKLKNSTWGDLVPSSTKRPPLKRLVTGEKRLRMALKNCACPGWGRTRTRARASRAPVGRFFMVITVSAPGQSLWWTGWLAGHTPGAALPCLPPCLLTAEHMGTIAGPNTTSPNTRDLRWDPQRSASEDYVRFSSHLASNSNFEYTNHPPVPRPSSGQGHV